MVVSKKLMGLMFISVYIFALLGGLFVGGGLALDNLREEMEERNLVFCEPYYPIGIDVKPYAIPTNITWSDLGYDE